MKEIPFDPVYVTFPCGSFICANEATARSFIQDFQDLCNEDQSPEDKITLVKGEHFAITPMEIFTDSLSIFEDEEMNDALIEWQEQLAVAQISSELERVNDEEDLTFGYGI